MISNAERFHEIDRGVGFDDDEVEFMMAMDRYKRVAQRPFPTWHEVLRVIRELGYCKPARLQRRAPRPHSE